MHAQRLVAEIAVQAIFYGSVLFIAAVSTFWPWWRTQLGWTIIAKSAALALAVMPAMFIYWFGRNTFTQSDWLGWVSVGALLMVPPILAWRGIVLWRVQRHGAEPH